MTERRWFGLNAGASNWLWLGVAVMALDQWTKALIVEPGGRFVYEFPARVPGET